jgi:Omp85 superfamily domain
LALAASPGGDVFVRVTVMVFNLNSCFSQKTRTYFQQVGELLRWFTSQILLLLVMLTAAVGQHASDARFVSCTQTDQRVELTVEARLTPATESAPQRLSWVIKRMPTPQMVIVNCPLLKRRILEELTKQQAADGSIPIAINSVPINEHLMNEITGVDDLTIILPGGLDADPLASDVGREFKVVLCVTYAGQCPDESNPRATIRITTKFGALAPLAGLPDFTLADADARFSSSPAGRIPVQIAYGAEDLLAAKKDPVVVTDDQAHGRVRSELFRVAVTAFEKALQVNGLDENGVPTFGLNDPAKDTVSTAFVRELKGIYSLQGQRADVDVDWGLISPRLDCEHCLPGPGGTPTWVFKIEGLSLVEGINIEILEEDWETEQVQGKNIAVKLRKRRQKAYALLNAPGNVVLSTRVGQVATTAQIQSDLDNLKSLVEAVEKVRSGPVVTPTRGVAAVGPNVSHNVIFVVRRKKRPDLDLAIKAGGSYSKENDVTGLLGVEEINLLRLKETVKLSAEAGGEVQRYRLSATRPFTRSETPRLEIRDASIDIKYFADKDQRLGNLTADEIAAREAGSSVSLSFGYDSVAASDRVNENCVTDLGRRRKRTRFGFLADVALSYRDVNIPADSELLTITGISPLVLPQARTQTTTLSFGINGVFRHDFRKAKAGGLGVFALRVNETLSKGFELFGADYQYWKSQTVVSADLTFGFKSYRDMFVHYQHGYERSSAGTPIFELPLMGGPESVRGIEAGEFIGSRVSSHQFDLGFNAASFLNLVRGKGRIDDSSYCPFDPNATPPAGPFDFKSLYFKVFFDRGGIADSPVTVGAGVGVNSFTGYGAAFELRDLLADESGRRVNLAIGYARSPESKLHRRGLVFTSVTFEF